MEELNTVIRHIVDLYSKAGENLYYHDDLDLKAYQKDKKKNFDPEEFKGKLSRTYEEFCDRNALLKNTSDLS